MKLSFDPRHNIAYIRLADATAQVETIRVSEEMNIDMSPDGRIYGIELLNANELLKPLLAGKLTLTNEATGDSIEVAFP